MSTSHIISIYAEMTPNPMAMKFVADKRLVPEGVQFEFLKPEEAAPSPLAQKLYELPFVKGIFISSNFITILKNDKAMWDDMVFDVRDYIKDYLQSGGKVWNTIASPTEQSLADTSETTTMEAIRATQVDHTEPANETENKIIEALEQYVKPAVENDGGVILFRSFKDGIVTLQLSGSCSGCPSSTLTLKSAVEQLLTRMVPEVKEVQQEVV
jgi:NFU1 iron-sulfur cluster scaffold homolog, mitochondrial